ncbi:MAG: cysteine synthase family protein [Deltaproteobacteria bacterium]|jgi:cysteine synthase B|nr:cysteine synthase family protein [Deltaproteobacteria bacterium]
MSVVDLVGKTPIVSLEKLSLASGARVWAKAEFLNPSGSVKDRAAKYMILEGLRSGNFGPERALIDATSGNTGVAYAMIGAALGRRVILHMPANANYERKALIRAYGAEIFETDPLEGSDGAFISAQKEYLENPDKYFFPNQYHNPANPLAHYQSTGPEIWEQTQGQVTHFVNSLGTSGTFIGTARYLKEKNQAVKTIIVQPDSPFHGIEGTKHMDTTLKPSIYDISLVDGQETVSTSQAIFMAKKLAREEGLLVGISAGANVTVALRMAARLSQAEQVVTILGDSGSRYLSDGTWDE